jgi:hypothetical protein
MTSRADVLAATRLVRRALDRERPKVGGDYEMLLARYRTDTAFADTVAAVCEGLSLYPLGVGPAGLIVHGDMDGPFRVTLDNSGLRNAREAEHRHIYALVLAGIAAYGYRDTGALIDTAAPVIRPLDLEKFLARAVDRVAGVRDGHDATDVDGDDWEVLLGEAGRQWRKRPAYHETPQGRPKVGCHRWYTTTVLEWLVERDMAVRQVVLSDERGMAYQLTDRFRLGIGDLVETDAFAALTAPDNQPLDPDRATNGDDAAVVDGAVGNERGLGSSLGPEGKTAD